MTGNIDLVGLAAHMKATLKKVVANALESHKVLGPGWMEESIKIDIAWAASHQNFVPTEEYIEIAAITLRDILTKFNRGA